MENIDNNINIKIGILCTGVLIAITVMLFLHCYKNNAIINGLKNKKKK